MTGSNPDAAASDTAHRYTAQLAGEIESRWQQLWSETGVYEAPNPVGPLAGDLSVYSPDDKMFIQDMFPYPSGAGLHVGHPLGFIATDVFARFCRMDGRNVLHTMGFDSFGLPAEQYAVQTGTHPRTTTDANIERYLGQIRRLGLGHDERRRVATTDVEFYRWTQWIFLQIYNAWFDPDADGATGSGRGKARPIAELIAEFDSGTRTLDDGRSWSELAAAEKRAVVDDHRLVYLSNSLVNWCPGLGTVLANEEVTADGRSERGNFPVFRKNLRQWMMRITAYSDRLLDDLDLLDWPEKVKTMQRNWIGRSRGAHVDFALPGDRPVKVFTTRPDTLFGATYMVLAPEHELVDEIIADSWPSGVDERWTGGASTPGEAVAAYRASIAAKSDLERQENKEKTGVFTGAYATNPVNGEQIPVFIADYVLIGYGTGAIMAVPGHDARDYEFATAFGLPIREVIGSEQGIAESAWTGDGPLVNSGFLDGLPVDEAKAQIVAKLEADGSGIGTVQYKLRDWLFARQRYWGEPFPIVYDADGNAHPLPESMLPVELPEVEDYAPVAFDPDDADSEPSPPLAKATEWARVELDLGDGVQTYTRDVNVMPQWAGSSWYQLRYIDPTNSEFLCAKENEEYWMGPRPSVHGPDDPGGLDLYIGGMEHAVLHLLYSRFWHKVLFDLGFVTSKEPYRRLFNQGMIQAYAYTDARGVYVPADDVSERDGKFYLGDDEVFQEYGKMGKSLKNSVAPDDICRDYGADTLRVYEMSMGPLDQSRPWATKDVVGAQRFLQRAWRLVVDEESGAVRVTDAQPTEDDLRALHKAIAGVRDDYANLRTNTAGAKLIELTNHLTKAYPAGAPRAVVEPLVVMLAPLAPHIADELWERLGHGESLAHGPFPVADEQWLAQDSIEIPIQVKGKVRSRITVAVDADEETVRAAALADEKIVALLDGEPRKVIVVPGRMVNVVP
ncbi:MAG TPA: leucine--tRNA ligase [Gordonia sp. (in: high G+C Gram-positive bacteria)]|uniref:leucine--tRNA ligase n=3 Tax=Gordonia TaxID=2053 RepID=UPI000FBB1B5A|nr:MULTISPECIES: leucine--tRNA ligase [unclassified Gordonia (in: high G+C Gram-positive bacteria)]RUP38974.1 MAG: leucine--tRNA ligase [Gordonia sp. (in: high G+C Gram-positive bacteria)]HNP56411.1 leucine--tRNA ligase [Gordonia sp. (in: high G+C Gram-positive bacteria)]HRC51247.1 leucine--tRNA ligase [Gordonia sp. (in: high G+C Gram-positive bacteria)]